MVSSVFSLEAVLLHQASFALDQSVDNEAGIKTSARQGTDNRHWTEVTYDAGICHTTFKTFKERASLAQGIT